MSTEANERLKVPLWARELLLLLLPNGRGVPVVVPIILRRMTLCGIIV
jgi:hypothetical protein